MADVFLICVIVIAFFILSVIGLYLVVKYQHPDDKNDAYIPKLVVLFGFVLSGATVFALPLDVANNEGYAGKLWCVWLCSLGRGIACSCAPNKCVSILCMLHNLSHTQFYLCQLYGEYMYVQDVMDSIQPSAVVSTWNFSGKFSTGLSQSGFSSSSPSVHFTMRLMTVC